MELQEALDHRRACHYPDGYPVDVIQRAWEAHNREIWRLVLALRGVS